MCLNWVGTIFVLNGNDPLFSIDVCGTALSLLVAVILFCRWNCAIVDGVSNSFTGIIQLFGNLVFFIFFCGDDYRIDQCGCFFIWLWHGLGTENALVVV